MKEDKVIVLELFRVRAAARDRIESKFPGLLARAVAARHALLEGGAHVLGPARIEFADGHWWTIAWQFPDAEAARRLGHLHDDPDWRACVETRTLMGHKYDPADGLPGF